MLEMDIPQDLRITITDARLAGHCVRGVKDWFERHELDFAVFLRDGISAEEFITRGDALSARIVELKLEREQNG
jgi:hypothetical protein